MIGLVFNRIHICKILWIDGWGGVCSTVEVFENKKVSRRFLTVAVDDGGKN
jgi:hypothetical protein